MVVVPCESVSGSNHAPSVAVMVLPEKSLEITLFASAVPENVTLVVAKVAFTLGEVMTGRSGAVVSPLTPVVLRMNSVTG